MVGCLIKKRETSHPPFFFHVFTFYIVDHCSMVACYPKLQKACCFVQGRHTHVVWPVRGMQQATKPAQRPFNNVLGPCKRQMLCFISIAFLSWHCFFLFPLLKSPLLFHAIKLLQIYSDELTVKLLFIFHFLTNSLSD